jgi:hypothetical protein
MFKTGIVFFAAGLLTVAVINSTASPSVTHPVIVAKGKLVNQTAPVATTTLFTPNYDGVYRLSFYGTLTQANLGSNDQWWVNLFWTDDSGLQLCQPCLVGGDRQTGQFSQFDFLSGQTSLLIEAKASTPIQYDVIQTGTPDNTAYSLYWIVERLD